jgi:hypothetical protein
LDPPYYETEIGTYSNINHEALLDMLCGARFRWALSGYPSDLYTRRLRRFRVYWRRRGAELKSGASGKRHRVVECLWTNYVP